MNETIFKNLIDNLVCQTGTDIDVVGFIGEWEDYELHFTWSDDYGLDVDSLGDSNNQYKPTKEQLKTLDKIIDNQYNENTNND